MSYFNYCAGLTMTSARVPRVVWRPAARSGNPLTQRDMDLAASVQVVCEDVMLRSARHLHALTGVEDLVWPAGCALNCVGNGGSSRDELFEQMWIQPAAGDAGGALGAALTTWHHVLGAPSAAGAARPPSGSYLGPRSPT